MGKDETLEFLKLTEVAKFLKVGVGTLLRFKEESGFPVTKFGQHTFRVNRARFEEWLKNRQSE